MAFAFAEYVLDVDQRRLLREGRDVRLTLKAFELLHVLVARSPRALSKDEIIGHIWSDTFVNEGSLATLVAELRLSLNDQARQPRFIRTVYGYGYAFHGTLLSGPDPGVAPSSWRLIHGSREIHLASGESILGRSGPGVVPIDIPGVSRRHARMTIQGDRVTLQDLGSKNGTWVGEMTALAPIRLQDGDSIRLGPVVVLVRSGGRETETETDAPAALGAPARLARINPRLAADSGR